MRELQFRHSFFILSRFVEHMLPKIPVEVALSSEFVFKLREKLNAFLIHNELGKLIKEIELHKRGGDENVSYLSLNDEFVVINIPTSDSSNFIRVAVDCNFTDLFKLSPFLISLSMAIRELQRELSNLEKSENIVGIPEDVVMKIKKAAFSTLPCLILGETGVGKEVVAECIHKWSGRKGPFVVVNCGAIPHGLFENELFGHEPNSFTGSSKIGLKGKIEVADGGTLFLDEVGEISLYSQAKLLRVIERGEFWKLGAVKPTKVDVRFIAATNRPLREFVGKGRFRKDLYYRLKGVEIVIPPLRERKELIEDLIKVFLNEFSGGRVYFTREAIQILKDYSWPGNVRELKYFIQCVVDEVKDGSVSIDKIRSILGMDKSTCSYLEAKRNFDKSYILSALELNEWNITKTAQQLGMSRRWLQLKLRELGLRNYREFSKT